jgi:TolB protein
LAGTDKIIQVQPLAYHLSGDMHPTLLLMVYRAPIDNGCHLWTMDISDKRVKNRLTDGEDFALTPVFSADGNHIYFIAPAENRQLRLMQILTYGGTSPSTKIIDWDYDSSTGTLGISVVDNNKIPIAARYSVI